MKKPQILFFTFLLIFLASCEKECTLKPIPKNIFDLSKMEKTSIYQCGKEIDSLVLVDTLNHYEKSSKKSPMVNRECEHAKLYEVIFKEEHITVILRKNDANLLNLELYAFGNCGKISDDFRVTEKELALNKEYTFEREKDCDSNDSKIKKITFSGCLINSIMTSDNRIWTPK